MLYNFFGLLFNLTFISLLNCVTSTSCIPPTRSDLSFNAAAFSCLCSNKSTAKNQTCFLLRHKKQLQIMVAL